MTDATPLQNIQFTRDMAPPSARWMGMDVVEHRPEEKFSKLSFTPNADMINFGGVIQGGFLTAMMDDACGFNTFVCLGMKSALASIDIHTHFYKAVALGNVTVEARVTRAGKSVVFVEAKLFDQDDELAASMTSSMKIRSFTELQYETGKKESSGQ